MPERRWRNDLEPTEWDARLAHLGGHPLQSALWGDARRHVDGIEDLRLMLGDEASTTMMARIEKRRAPLLGNIAWIPKGPAHTRAPASADRQALIDRLGGLHFILTLDNPYPDEFIGATGKRVGRPVHTAIVPLSIGEGALWDRLDRQWRYGVGRAAREGVVIEETRHMTDVHQFASLCEAISEQKAFALPGSPALMQRLIEAGETGAVTAHLFVARSAKRLAAGALVIRVGRRLHYFWGGTDRAYKHKRPGEALHWHIMRWAILQGMTAYDLEGVDPVRNPGTYRFKLKMGAVETELPPSTAFTHVWQGRAALRLLQWTKRL